MNQDDTIWLEGVIDAKGRITERLGERSGRTLAKRKGRKDSGTSKPLFGFAEITG